MSFVQAKTADSSVSATSLTATYNNAVSAGNWLIAIVRYGETTDNLTSIADNVNAGNWSVKINQTETTAGTRLYVAIKENTGAGTPTVTATFSVSDTIRMIVAEYGNVVSSSSIDTALSQDNSSTTTTPSTPTAVTSHANCTIITCLSTSNDIANLTVTDNGYTSRAKLNAGSNNILLTLSDIDVMATGSYSETYTLGTSDATSSGIIAVISPGGGGGSTGQQAAGQSIIRLQGPLWR